MMEKRERSLIIEKKSEREKGERLERGKEVTTEIFQESDKMKRT